MEGNFYGIPKERLNNELNKCTCISEIKFYSPEDIRYSINNAKTDSKCSYVLKDLESAIKYWEHDPEIAQQTSILKISNPYHSQCIYNKGTILFPNNISKYYYVSELKIPPK